MSVRLISCSGSGTAFVAAAMPAWRQARECPLGERTGRGLNPWIACPDMIGSGHARMPEGSAECA